MSTCPEQDMHSVYLDGELPQKYVLVQIILKDYDTRNVIALLLYPIPSKYVTAQTTQSKY